MLVGLLLALSGTTITLWWQRRRTHFLLQYYRSELGRRALVQHFDKRTIAVEGKRLCQAICRDTTERKHATRLQDMYPLLSETNQAIVRAENPRTLFHQVCRITVNHGHFKLAWIGLVDADTHLIKPVAVNGPGAPYLSTVRISADAGSPEGWDPIGTAIREGTYQVCNDFLSDPHALSWYEAASQAGIRAVASFPLTQADQVIGALSVYAGETGFCDAQLLDLLREMASDISYALDNFARERRRQAEQALRESERFAHAVIDALSEQICVLDETGTIIAVNRAWHEFIATHPAVASQCAEGANCLALSDEVIGEMAGPAASFAAGIRAVLKGEREAFSLEYPYHSSAGSPLGQRWYVGRVTRFPSDGLPRLVIVHENITERKLAEEAIKEQSRFLRTMIDHLPVAVFAKSAKDGRFVLWNKASESLFGLTAERALGRTDYDFFPKEQADCFAQKDRETLARGTVEDIPEEPIDSLTLGRRILHTLKVPIYQQDGTPLYLLAISEDITQRRQAQERLLLWATLLEHSTQAIIITDAERRILTVNRAFTEMTGFTLDEVYGQNPRLLKFGASQRSLLSEGVDGPPRYRPLGRGGLEPTQERGGISGVARHQCRAG